MPWALCSGLCYLFIHLVVTATWNTYDNNYMLDLKLYLLKYYRLLIDQLIKRKKSNLNNLEGLDASKPSKFFFHIFLMHLPALNSHIWQPSVWCSHAACQCPSNYYFGQFDILHLLYMFARQSHHCHHHSPSCSMFTFWHHDVSTHTHPHSSSFLYHQKLATPRWPKGRNSATTVPQCRWRGPNNGKLPFFSCCIFWY